jgi:hypothetical protein
MAKAKNKMGRPPKADKFTAFMSFPCHPWHGEALEEYRADHRLRSKGEAMRQIISELPQAKRKKP